MLARDQDVMKGFESYEFEKQITGTDLNKTYYLRGYVYFGIAKQLSAVVIGLAVLCLGTDK